MFQRLLVPLDGTKGSEKALPYALGLARALDAEVILCYVITAPASANTSRLPRYAGEYLDGIGSRFSSEGVSVKLQVRRGDALTEIKTVALDWGVDAIVMATKGRTRFEKLLLGSISDSLVRETHVPVILVSSRHVRDAEQAA